MWQVFSVTLQQNMLNICNMEFVNIYSFFFIIKSTSHHSKFIIDFILQNKYKKKKKNSLVSWNSSYSHCQWHIDDHYVPILNRKINLKSVQSSRSWRKNKSNSIRHFRHIEFGNETISFTKSAFKWNSNTSTSSLLYRPKCQRKETN